MRYGKSSGVHEVDETARRQPSQTLKKAQPGAPFGWTEDGTPYHGTTYAIKLSPGGLKFASISSRKAGAPQFFWKNLSELSAKVALSALETHGSVAGLRAGESDANAGDIFDAEVIQKARAVFVRAVGEETMRRFEDAESDSEPPEDDAKEEKPAASDAVKKEATPGASSSSSSKTSEKDVSEAVGKKRKARMAMADEIKAEVEASKKAPHSEICD